MILSEYVITIAASFVTSLVIVYLISRIKNPKLLGLDVHKPYRVYVPRIGGVSIITSMAVIAILSYIFNNARLLALSLVTVTVGLIGLVDDLKGLPVSIRVFLPLVPALIIPFVTHYYVYILLIGHVHNFFVVAFLSMLAVTVMANAVNMLDVLNGIVPSSSLMILIISGLMSYLAGFSFALPATVVLTAALIPLLAFNWYPAKVFNGNSGSYAIGAMLGSFMVLYNAGTQGVIASLPYIINGFMIVISARGFKPKETLLRPTIVNDGIIHANTTKGSPYTLVKLLVLRRPKTEKEVVRDLLIIFGLSGIIAILASLIAIYH